MDARAISEEAHGDQSKGCCSLTSCSRFRQREQNGGIHVLPVIEVAGLHKEFISDRQYVQALKDINFTVEAGEFVSIVGQSGCGKSTLLRCIAGLEQPTAGKLAVSHSASRFSEGIGFVFQAPVLLPWLTVLENVLLPIRVFGYERARYVDKAMGLLQMTGLEAFADYHPGQLSGGMQQRVGIVRALIHDPVVLLMDEPFSALDAQTRESMQLELQRIQLNRQQTIMFVTHDLEEAVLLSDRIIVLSPRPGRVQEIISVALPRPRRIEQKYTGEFADVVFKLRELIWGEAN